MCFFLTQIVDLGLSSGVAVVKAVTGRWAAGGGDSTAPTGARIMGSGFQWSHAKHRRTAVRMFSGLALLTKGTCLSSEGRDSCGKNTFSLHC